MNNLTKSLVSQASYATNTDNKSSSVTTKLAKNLSSISNYSLSLSKSQATNNSNNAFNKLDTHLDDIDEFISHSLSSVSTPFEKTSSNLDDFKSN